MRYRSRARRTLRSVSAADSMARKIQDSSSLPKLPLLALPPLRVDDPRVGVFYRDDLTHPHVAGERRRRTPSSVVPPLGDVKDVTLLGVLVVHRHRPIDDADFSLAVGSLLAGQDLEPGRIRLALYLAGRSNDARQFRPVARVVLPALGLL